MAWLIEAYLEEGKHGPDHPESYEMKNKNDHYKKKEDKISNMVNKAVAAEDKLKAKKDLDNNMSPVDILRYNGLNKEKKDEMKEVDDAEKRGDVDDSNHHLARAIYYADKKGDIIQKANAVSRHNRRHPEQKVNPKAGYLNTDLADLAVNRESSWLFESIISEDVKPQVDDFLKNDPKDRADWDEKNIPKNVRNSVPVKKQNAEVDKKYKSFLKQAKKMSESGDMLVEMMQ